MKNIQSINKCLTSFEISIRLKKSFNTENAYNLSIHYSKNFFNLMRRINLYLTFSSIFLFSAILSFFKTTRTYLKKKNKATA